MAVDTPQTKLRISLEKGDEFVLSLDPLQGYWTEEQYLLLSNQTNRLLEYTDGYIEILPVTTDKHQAILAWLFLALKAFVEQRGGTVRFAPLRMRVREGMYREPDILLVLNARDPRRQNSFWLGADLVVEIVSEDDPERDIKVKRADYASARIPEYWIVNLLDHTITVLVLEGEEYAEYGIFGRGGRAESRLLEGFAVSVDEVFDAE